MEISSSILDLNPKIKSEIQKIWECNVDYIHLDVMDGKFVSNVTFPYNQAKELILENIKYDVHLMAEDVKKYIDDYSKINPEYITFHLEIGSTLKWIQYLKEKKIKVGISINPNTKVEEIFPYLSKIDLVLVMSVEPGLGGQTFIENTLNKIQTLDDYRKENNLSFKIEVDGGIHDKNISKLKKCDIVVIGSFITKGNYQEQINKIKGAMI